MFTTILFAQQEELITYGLKIGATHAEISSIPEMLTGTDNSLQQYSLTSEGTYGIESGIFANFKLYETRVAIQTELLFQKSSTKVNYSDATGKTYTIGFNYNYIALGAIYKIYPVAGVNVGFGGFYNIILNPSNISYTSNQYSGQYDTQYRQFYRDGFAGNNDFSLSLSLGYEFYKNFNLDLRYYLGISDAIKTKENSYEFIENNNRSATFSFSIGYSFERL
jgi:hypothetical protein